MRHAPSTSHPNRAALALAGTLLLGGCAGTARPLLYPDHHGARSAVDQCVALARGAGANAVPGREVARDTALGAAAGGAATGIYGAVRGLADVGESAAAGAAAGAALGLIRGLLGGTEPAPIFRRYVERCLAERGHDVIGWR